MTLQEIKQAVQQGKTVHWANEGYRVLRDKFNQWFIVFHTGNAIGLTWQDGVTLNGKEHEFYIAE